METKSSTSYSINLARIAEYRQTAALRLQSDIENLSILLVVGPEETSDLEAQVRGSPYAWNVRLLGIRSLHRLLQLKETLDDPVVGRQVQEVLFPQEFTRLDRIIDLVFATAEDTQGEETEIEQEPSGHPKPPAAFHGEILPKLEKALGFPLIKRSRVTWASPDSGTIVSCQVSSKREHAHAESLFWFGLKSKTAELLDSAPTAYCAFGLGSPDLVALVPYSLIREYLPGYFTSPNPDGTVMHYHVRFLQKGSKVFLLTNRDRERLDISSKLLPSHSR